MESIGVQESGFAVRRAEFSEPQRIKEAGP